MSRVHVVLGGDDGCAFPLAVTLSSVLRSAPTADRPCVWILSHGISAVSRARVTRVARRLSAETSVTWLEVDTARLDGLDGAEHFSVASYLRVLLPELLPDDVMRALWIDVDTLVRRDLRALVELDLGGASVAAAQDYAITNTHSELSGLSGVSSIPIRPYFNAGVLLLDLEAWRRDGLTHQVVRYGIEHGPLRHADQDALNAVVDSVLVVDPLWNVQYALLFLEQHESDAVTTDLIASRRHLLHNAYVVHFSGLLKPWQHWSPHPLTNAWVAEARRSGFWTPPEFARWWSAWAVKRTVSKLRQRVLGDAYADLRTD